MSWDLGFRRGPQGAKAADEGSSSVRAPRDDRHTKRAAALFGAGDGVRLHGESSSARAVGRRGNSFGARASRDNMVVRCGTTNGHPRPDHVSNRA